MGEARPRAPFFFTKPNLRRLPPLALTRSAVYRRPGVTSLQPRTERPPEGISRGVWEAPRWTIAALGVAVVLGALVYLVWRAKRNRRQPNLGGENR